VKLRARTLPVWVGLVAGLVLATRALVYALANTTPLTERLSGSLGGPQAVVVAAVAVGLGLVLAVGVLGLATLAVRERWALAESRTRGVAPRMDLRRFAVRAGVLWAVTALGFAALENYVHWRAGLGFHGLACLVGPVHVNALPVAATLGLVASALVGAAEHLVRWARRVAAALGARPRPRRSRVARARRPAAVAPSRTHFAFQPLLPRPPPALAAAI